MWGTHLVSQRLVSHQRFIPTHVGNSDLEGDPGGVHPVHPHACGELGYLPSGPGASCGSSPRMWGTLIPSDNSVNGLWFIPTHVGNSQAKVLNEPAITVHPHACGELMGKVAPIPRVFGSSPRMWGTRFFRDFAVVFLWFIPTHVGNSYCQEGFCKAHRGSSPRMWGTLFNLYMTKKSHISVFCFLLWQE